MYFPQFQNLTICFLIFSQMSENYIFQKLDFSRKIKYYIFFQRNGICWAFRGDWDSNKASFESIQ